MAISVITGKPVYTLPPKPSAAMVRVTFLNHRFPPQPRELHGQCSFCRRVVTTLKPRCQGWACEDCCESVEAAWDVHNADGELNPHKVAAMREP